MANVTNPYAARRRSFNDLLGAQADAMQQVIAGVADIDATLERQRAQRRQEAEAKRKAEREEAKDTLAVNERTYERNREQQLDRERAEDRAERTQAITAAEARRKAAEDAEAKRKADAENRERIVRTTGVDMARGLSRDELARRATLAGLEGPDDLLAQVDQIEQDRLRADEDRKAKAAELAAKTKKAEADARKAARGPGPMSPEAKRLQDARLRKAEADARAAEAAAKAAEGGGGKAAGPAGGKLTPAEVEGVVEIQGARKLLDDLGTMKTEGNIDTGPIAAAGSWLASKAGMADPKRVEFKALVGTQIADYIKSISGATVSEGERAQLLQNVPTEWDNDKEFMAKLATVKRILDNKLAAKRRAYAATGRPTAIFDVPDDVAPVPPAKRKSGDDEFDSLPE